MKKLSDIFLVVTFSIYKSGVLHIKNELTVNDNIERFTFHYTKNEIELSNPIKPSIYETNPFLIENNPTVIEYSAFYGSIQILRFLFQNQIELTPSLWLYAIHGKNPEIIHFLEENHVCPKDESYQDCLEESIKCHHNDFALYFLNNLIVNNEHSNYLKNEIYYGFRFYNFQFIPVELKEPFCFFYAVEHDYYKLVEYYTNVEGLNINDMIISYRYFIKAFQNYQSINEIALKTVKFSLTFQSHQQQHISEIKLFLPVYCFEEISIPSSIVSIGNHSFENCIKLREITIPQTVELIGEYAFSHCQSLTKIIIPSSVIEIKDHAFIACDNLSEITIPTSVISIGDFAFSGCQKLEKIAIPSSVTFIGKNLFEGCINLVSIEIPASIVSIGDNAFKNCQSLTNVMIPRSVTSIGNNAFEDCKNLVNIVIPSSVTTIGDEAFNGCQCLTKMIIPKSVTSIGNCFINKCIGLNKISIPPSIPKMGVFCFANFRYITEFIIPSTVTVISWAAFEHCISLKKVVIPSSVTKIEQYAFHGCLLLTEITIPQSVTGIDKCTFAYCKSLKKVNIPSSIVSIGPKAFYQCNSLVYITIPSSVKYIVFNAFDECSSLEKIIVKKDPKEIAIIDELPDCLIILLIGGVYVGKTSLVHRITKNRFLDSCMTTISVDFIAIHLDINGLVLKLQIWDTPGIPKYHETVKQFYRHKQGMIIVFDLSNRESFNTAKMFFEEIKEANIGAPLILLGNKSDLDHNVVIEDINELVNKYNSKYFEVSVRDNINVAESLLYIGNKIMEESIRNCPFEKLLYYDESKQDEKKCDFY